MTEKRFIEQNIEKWRELESLLKNSSQNPERLHTLFVEVSSDLSYARTFFANRSVRFYLNNLTQEVFDKLGKKKRKYTIEPIRRFFAHTLPLEVYQARRSFLISFVIFILAVGIGAFSTSQNPRFLAVIIGDDYVEMTEQNINEGDPMKVYKDSEQVDMFFGITVNNIRVSFMVFVMGIIGGLGTVFILIYNGIMLGAFQYFFYTKGLFVSSFLTIWIHGTIEISAIIIAGAAGLVLGKGVLFPGTFKRSTSLQMASLKAIRILLGTVPLFVLAGFLESFVTRHTELPTIVKAFIIGGSLFFILLMWVIYPYYYYQKNKDKIDSFESLPASDKEPKYVLYSYRNFEENFSKSISDYKRNIPSVLKKIIIPLWLVFSFSMWVNFNQIDVVDFIDNPDWSVLEEGSIWNYMICLIGFSFIYCLTVYFQGKRAEGLLAFIKTKGLEFLFLGALTILPFLLLPSVWFIVLYFLILPPHFLVMWMNLIGNNKGTNFNEIKASYSRAWKYYVSIIPQYLLIAFYFLMLYLLLVVGLGSLLYQLIMWHELFDTYTHVEKYFTAIMTLLSVALVVPFYIYDLTNVLASLICRDQGLDLEKRFLKFGKHSSIFETA